MQSNGYQLLALGARALFVFLAALIVLRAALSLLREHRARKRLLKRLPDAGMVGEMRDVDSDTGYPLPREGVLGGGRGCDIRLKGLRRRQVNFAYVEGKGILLTPCHRRTDTLLDGVPLGRGAYALHGAMLRVGGYTLRIRLFAGLNVPHPAQYQEHWQPVFEEELYAPEYGQFTAVQPYTPVQAWPQAAPYGEEDAPVFSYAPTEQVFETQSIPVQRAPEPPVAETEDALEAPLPFDGFPTESAKQAEDDPAPFEVPVRHRRSERRREL